jgi:hypothetical protein
MNDYTAFFHVLLAVIPSQYVRFITTPVCEYAVGVVSLSDYLSAKSHQNLMLFCIYTYGDNPRSALPSITDSSAANPRG